MINKTKNLIIIFITFGLFLLIFGCVSASPTLTVNKLVRNVSGGTSYLDSVSANPNEIVSFSIQVTAGDTSLQNIIVKDTLPDKMTYLGNLRINDVLSTGNIISGINIGDLSANQTMTITFDAGILGPALFNLGETTLINTVLVYNNLASNSDTAKVVVRKTTGGPATGVSTGLTNNLFLDSFFLPLTITLVMIWAFKSHIIKFEEWLDSRKKEYCEYRAQKLLNKIRTQEILRKINHK